MRRGWGEDPGVVPGHKRFPPPKHTGGEGGFFQNSTRLNLNSQKRTSWWSSLIAVPSLVGDLRFMLRVS